MFVVILALLLCYGCTVKIVHVEICEDEPVSSRAFSLEKFLKGRAAPPEGVR